MIGENMADFFLEVDTALRCAALNGAAGTLKAVRLPKLPHVVEGVIFK